MSKRDHHGGLETSTAAERLTEKFGLDMRSDGGGDVEYGSWFLWRGRNGMDQMAVLVASGAEALGTTSQCGPRDKRVIGGVVYVCGGLWSDGAWDLVSGFDDADVDMCLERG